MRYLFRERSVITSCYWLIWIWLFEYRVYVCHLCRAFKVFGHENEPISLWYSWVQLCIQYESLYPSKQMSYVCPISVVFFSYTSPFTFRESNWKYVQCKIIISFIWFLWANKFAQIFSIKYVTKGHSPLFTASPKTISHFLVRKLNITSRVSMNNVHFIGGKFRNLSIILVVTIYHCYILNQTTKRIPQTLNLVVAFFVSLIHFNCKIIQLISH